jgi:5'-methylthioadenosine phosphorylase
MTTTTIGIIGGSGLYAIDGISNVRQVHVSTPFGEPSDLYTVGTLGDKNVVFLPRHGHGHRYSPSEINYRANVFGFRSLGVDWLISVSAVGSLREHLAPGELVVVDQFIDLTKMRQGTFFGAGVVGHVSMASPVCSELAEWLAEGAREAGGRVHVGGTYVCIEGPQFSTQAESRLYQQWGADVIGMTNMPEAKLAREAGLCYATLAMVTDYDCWHTSHEAVTVEDVVAVMKANVDLARATLAHTVRRVDSSRSCRYRGTAQTGVMTAAEAADPATLARLQQLWAGETR